MSKFGYLPDKEDKRDYKVTRLAALLKAQIPSVVDWTKEMTGVENQWNEGTCVAFASIAMKEYQERKEWKRELDLSKRYLYQGCKAIDEEPGEGTYIRCAMDVLLKRGVCPESCWRYIPNVVGSPCKEADKLAQTFKILGYWRVDPEVDAIKESIYLNGPLVVGVDVYAKFESAPGGVVPMPTPDEEYLGGHAICLVGYDDGKHLFKFKNSWGVIWGDGGYGYLHYDYVEPYLSDAWSCKDSLGGTPPEPSFWEKIVAWFMGLFKWMKR